MIPEISDQDIAEMVLMFGWIAVFFELGFILGMVLA